MNSWLKKKKKTVNYYMLHEAERNNNVAHKESLILSMHKDFELRLHNQPLELISSEF